MAIFLFMNFTLPMTKLVAKLLIENLKQKQGQSVKTPTK